MGVVNIISFLGGLALFLYGVTLMGDGMKLMAGSRLGSFINRVTGSPVKALGIGAGMSAIIQSTSAVSIMAMGFVNTNLIRLRQALYIVLGAMLGTSVTGWIVCISSSGSGGWAQFFSTSVIVGVIAILGIYLRKFSKSQNSNVVGDILLGCAVLMLGMSTMTGSMSPLQSNQEFLSLMVKLSNPVVGILIGIGFTCLVQSSAAAVATLQALALTGSLTFSVAIPVMLGITIGGALPVLISSMGLSVLSKRTALAHLLFDVIGAVICGGIFYIANAVHPFAFLENPVSIVGVAALNTLLRLVMIVVLTPLVGAVERLTVRVYKEKTPDKTPEESTLDLLEEHFLSDTNVALAQSRKVVSTMALLTKKNVNDAIEVTKQYSDELFDIVCAAEDLTDKYEDRLGSYLIKLSRKQFSTQQNKELYTYLHVITDLERMSDHAQNLAESAKEIHEKNIVFTDEARHELDVLKSAIGEIVEITIGAFVNNDYDAAQRVEPLEEHIDNLCDALKLNHVDRLQSLECTLEHGFIFNDLLNNCERISDHCSNIAVAMLEINNDVFDTHQYLKNVVDTKDESFRKYYEEYSQKYSL